MHACIIWNRRGRDRMAVQVGFIIT